jgi:radical SAM superfamily enzyme YgiQ (UPF0313 family)
VKIALIRPGLGLLGRRKYRSLACLEPKALALLAGLTPPEHDVVALDDRFEAISYDEPFDLVALSVGTFEASRAYEIADGFRARGKKVVLGGFHPSLCPDEAAQHCHAVAIGEAEAIWPRIVQDAASGALQPRYEQRGSAELAGCRPRLDVLAGKGYLPISVIQYGRGCVHNCEFCSIKAFYGGQVRYRPVADVVAEIKDAGRRWIFFSDDNLVADRARAKELLRAITPLRLHWTSQASLDFVDDPELLDLMVQSGCQCVVIGLETLDQETICQMGKGWSQVVDYERKLAAIRARGIMVYATFVFGYDGDRGLAFDQTYDFVMRNKLLLVNFNHLQPFPGTRLYERLERDGRLRYQRWWLDPGYRFGEVAFNPAGMSAQRLGDEAWRIRAAFHSYPSMLRRLLDRQANLASLPNALTFLATNIASRQEIDRKQGMQLGHRGGQVLGQLGLRSLWGRISGAFQAESTS